MPGGSNAVEATGDPLNLAAGIALGGAAAAAAGVAAWSAVAPSAQLFGPTIWRTSSARKIALTFDDGPNPAVTPQLLNLFDRHSVRATFFLIGKFARACPELVREISARGHVLGNHSHTHANLFLRSGIGIRDELLRCQEAIAAATRAHPPLCMRPPFGYRNPLLRGEIRRAGMHDVVMWSLICQDWKPQPPERLIEKLARAARADRPHGDIVLLHDGDHRALGGERLHVVAALEHWLPRWRDAGMEFVTMEPSSVADTSDTLRSPRA
jgi:peptidoglycan/xylan/chitin deacetylase (PgdA/CDA1 family)